MILDDSVIHENSEYVTINEFAKRLGISRSSVDGYLQRGKLQAKSINGSRVKYLQWDIQSKQFKMLRQNPANSKVKNGMANAGKARVRKAPAKKTMKPPKNIEVYDIKEPRLAEVPDESLELTGEPIINLDELDPMRYRDCWLSVDGDPVFDKNGRPQLDYEKLQQRLKAETYAFKLQKEKGEYVAKTDVLNAIQNIARLLNSKLDAIPGIYASRLIAEAKRITGYDFNDIERASIKNHLKNEGVEIMKSLQQEILNLTT